MKEISELKNESIEFISEEELSEALINERMIFTYSLGDSYYLAVIGKTLFMIKTEETYKIIRNHIKDNEFMFMGFTHIELNSETSIPFSAFVKFDDFRS